MKKSRFYVASALMSVFLLSALSPALAASETAAPAPAAEQTNAMTPRMGRGRAAPQVSLSDEKMKLVRSEMDKLKEASKDLTRDEMKLRREMHDILVAEKFDRQAYLAKHAEAEALRAKLGGMRAETMANLADQLTAQERMELPRLLANRHKGRLQGKRGAYRVPQVEEKAKAKE